MDITELILKANISSMPFLLHAKMSEDSNPSTCILHLPLPLIITFFWIFVSGRWGNTPLDEARIGGNKNLIKLLEEAMSAQLSEFSSCSQEIRGTTKTTTFASVILP